MTGPSKREICKTARDMLCNRFIAMETSGTVVMTLCLTVGILDEPFEVFQLDLLCATGNVQAVRLNRSQMNRLMSEDRTTVMDELCNALMRIPE